MSGGSVSGKYPVYKVVNEPGMLQAAHSRYPDAVCIYRTWYDNTTQEGRLREMQSGVETAWNHWYADHKALLANLPFAYFESYNEVGAPDHYLAFEKYRIEQLAKLGYKACVLNLATGNTDKAMWARAKGMVAAAIAYDALIGVHCYAEGVMSANCNDSYWREDGQWSGGELFPKVIDPDKAHTALRIVRDKRDLAAQGQGAARLVATELGCDDLAFPGNGIYKPFGIKTRGWRDCMQVWQRMGWLNGISTEGFYRKQLAWWAEATGCLGVVYTSGTAGDSAWSSFDVTGVL